MKLEIIKTKDGYMAQYPNGEYLMDKDGNNLFDNSIDIFKITEEKDIAWSFVVGMEN